MGIDPDDAELIESSYDGLRRFAAVVAPWDVDPDDVLHSVLVKVLHNRRLGSLKSSDSSAARHKPICGR